MSWSACEYCEGRAEMNLGQLLLCRAHGTVLTECVGGLEPLLEMSPEARRALADATLPRYVREEVWEPAPEYGD
ncbi:MAG TPA: hypothetical protein VK009_28335 [Chloroflexota bacterium]|nr:hypothetical protein [Chloroflexota bacterium]